MLIVRNFPYYYHVSGIISDSVRGSDLILFGEPSVSALLLLIDPGRLSSTRINTELGLNGRKHTNISIRLNEYFLEKPICVLLLSGSGFGKDQTSCEISSSIVQIPVQIQT